MSTSTSRAGDAILMSLFDTPQSATERALAARYAPIIRFDVHEPFLPLAAGYTVFRRSGPSPSFRQGYQVDLAPEDQSPASLAIEYAIWWDWDIGHLYELEHAWVFISEEGQVIRGAASWHGRFHDMRHDGQLTLEGDHVVLYSEPGKHAFAPTPEWFRERRRRLKRSPTSALAGLGGVLMTHYLEGRVICTPLHNLLVRSYLAREAFEPSWDFSQIFEFDADMLVPWPALADWIPARVNAWLVRLAHDIPTSSYRFLRIGHRGAAAHAPGNTLAGLRKAAELGADMVEFDVRQTADCQAVLMHDSYLIDAQGRIWPAHRSTLAELRAIDLGGGERVPTLADALEVCRTERMGAYIELKDGAAIPAVVSTIREHELAKYVIVGSFRPDWLADLKAAVPEIETSILFSSPHLDAVTLAQAIDATYVHPCWKHPDPSVFVTPEWVDSVRKAGLGIICGNEERPRVIAALRQVGVDAICSDAPELLQDSQ
jgi:glycerophosphoryl diester phosphodiesterase